MSPFPGIRECLELFVDLLSTLHFDLNVPDYTLSESFCGSSLHQKFSVLLLPPTNSLWSFPLALLARGAHGDSIMQSLLTRQNWPGRLQGLHST